MTPAIVITGMEELHRLRMELQLQKERVQDVTWVCNTVAQGDLSQKITVPVQAL
jgi:osomolarity two-component system sensor histidine kinase NIK1